MRPLMQSAANGSSEPKPEVGKILLRVLAAGYLRRVAVAFQASLQ